MAHWKYTNVNVEITYDDVINFIDKASTKEIKRIRKAVDSDFFNDTKKEGGLVRDMKLELLSLAFDKFSLEELEQRLGTKFNLM